ncbi:MAG: biotin--[acetyl-CoA-carboxylase] ligase [Clostridiales bacterium]|jgi:BirA family biotin operon repressor/biotin-[acetyl-CoA-carboxylase] ligase|nr:biotin--[acetyl-CoA-carboxylase] ligase [Clostridiales bacterium]
MFEQERLDILSHIKTNISPTIYIHQELASTNTVAKQLASGCPNYTVVIAKSQTSGYGRFGRSFESPVGGLYMSIVLKGQEYSNISLTAHVACAVCQALDNIISKPICIKWINDIIIERRKVCGISCESRRDTSGNAQWFVVGIGININDNLGDISPIILSHITTLSDHTNATINYHRLVANIIDNISKLPQDNTQLFANYSQRIPFWGEDIQVHEQGGSTYTAIARHINLKGQLIVEYEGNLLALDSQQVSTTIHK